MTTCTDCSSTDETHTYACQMNWSSVRDTQLDDLVAVVADIIADYQAGRIDDANLSAQIDRAAHASQAYDIEFAEVCDWLDADVAEIVERAISNRATV